MAVVGPVRRATVSPLLAYSAFPASGQSMQQGMTKARDAQQQEVARRVAAVPMRMGGLGLRSARRMVPAAHWASWADALALIEGRLPECAEVITATLELDDHPGVWKNSNAQRECSIWVDSSDGQFCPSFGEELAHGPQQITNVVSGSTAGNSTRPPPLKFTFGRPRHLKFWI